MKNCWFESQFWADFAGVFCLHWMGGFAWCVYVCGSVCLLVGVGWGGEGFVYVMCLRGGGGGSVWCLYILCVYVCSPFGRKEVHGVYFTVHSSLRVCAFC